MNRKCQSDDVTCNHQKAACCAVEHPVKIRIRPDKQLVETSVHNYKPVVQEM